MKDGDLNAHFSAVGLVTELGTPVSLLDLWPRAAEAAGCLFTLDSEEVFRLQICTIKRLKRVLAEVAHAVCCLFTR